MHKQAIQNNACAVTNEIKPLNWLKKLNGIQLALYSKNIDYLHK